MRVNKHFSLSLFRFLLVCSYSVRSTTINRNREFVIAQLKLIVYVLQKEICILIQRNLSRSETIYKKKDYGIDQKQRGIKCFAF